MTWKLCTRSTFWNCIYRSVLSSGSVRENHSSLDINVTSIYNLCHICGELSKVSKSINILCVNMLVLEYSCTQIRKCTETMKIKATKSRWNESIQLKITLHGVFEKATAWCWLLTFTAMHWTNLQRTPILYLFKKNWN